VSPIRKNYVSINLFLSVGAGLYEVHGTSSYPSRGRNAKKLGLSLKLFLPHDAQINEKSRFVSKAGFYL